MSIEKHCFGVARTKGRGLTRFGAEIARCLLLFAISCSLAACATGPRVVDHSFGFDIRNAVPEVQILDYRYGSSGTTGTRPAKWALEEGKPFYFQGVTGPIPVGDFLYVKWRIKETGQVFEETVDLRQRLARDIKDHEVYLDIEGPQLYVYLISRERVTPNSCPPLDERRRLQKSEKSRDRIFVRFCFAASITVIYPDQDKR